ncbi:MAG: hypothetical protein D8H98_09620 [Prevotella sp.]|nr:MAG: hypothetical protein D8H98_09620 [Prevotella sp.]
MVYSQIVIGRKLFNAVSTNRKPLVDAQLLMCLHDAVDIVHEQHGLQPPTLALASLHVFHATAIRTYAMQ